MILELPCRQDLFAYSFECSLDGATYTLGFRWSSRAQAWYWSLIDQNDQPVVQGRRVVVNWPLLRNVANVNAPLGEFYAIDTSGTDVEPGLTELGQRVKFIYVERGTTLEDLDV